MSSQPAQEALGRIVLELRSRGSEDLRRRAALELRELVIVTARDLPPERFLEFYSVVNTRISQLITHGTDPADRLGGIHALDALIDFDGVDLGQKVTRFTQCLRTVLKSKDLLPMQPAAVALGKLCRPGGSLISELVESEVKTALEWLQSDRVEERRYSAVLVLRELARNAPTLMYAFVGLVFDQIWVGLRDQRLLIRQTAAEAISASFQIIRERDQSMRQTWQLKIYDGAVTGIRQGTVENIHGSLLVIKELLQQGGMFMHEHYQEVCEIVFRHKDHRDVHIRRTVVMLIPELANYSPSEFVQGYLHKFMVFLSGMLKKDKDRNDSFLAIGNIANAVKSDIAPYLDGVLIYVREGLSVRSRRSGTVDPVFDCISRLAVAVGQTLSKYMEALLDPIFACELTPKLTQALVDMAFYIPPVKQTIQERLLDMLSKVLCGEHFKPLGAPTPNNISSALIVPKDSKDPLAYEHRQAEIKLALNTLGSFDFSGHVLNEFVRDVAIKYVEDENLDIREAAALTCCQLYVRDPVVNQTSYHAIQVVSDVIEKLLTVGVADPDPSIRRTVLAALDERFDRHLAKAENIRTLFFALNDEVFAVREVAIVIIGRLTHVNPAYVIPSLRKVLIQMLTELEFSDVARNKEESAKLLSLLVQNSQRLIKSYVNPMVAVLLPKARDSNPSVSSTILKAIGDLATVGCEDMKPYIDQLMPIIIDALQDQSSIIKREAALKTLGQLASNAGYVIKPYLDYPSLLEILQTIVRTEPHRGPLRQETIKLLGILGALDPYKHQQVEERSPESQLRFESTQLTDISLMMTGLTPSNKEYFPTVVINALLQIIKDQSLVQHHAVVVEAIMNIFRTLQLECIPFLDRVVPAFIAVIRGAPATKLDSYFSQLSSLVGIVRQHIRSFLPDIVTVLQEFWNHPHGLKANILQLIEAISRSLEGEFKVYLANILPLMLGALEKDNTTRRITSERVMHAFLTFGQSAEEYMHLIIPVIVGVFEKPQQPSFIRKLAIETVGKISRQVNLNDFASKIIHPLSRVLGGTDITLRLAALDALCLLIFQLGKDYLHFVSTINKVLAAQQITHQNYELLVSKLKKGEVLPQDLNADERFRNSIDDGSATEVQNKKLDSNPVHLKAAWDATGKSTKEDWAEWMRRLSVTVLTESPNQALRACASLAANHPPLARELFNSAFVSCWGDLFEPYQDDLIQNIELAIRSPHVTPDLLGILLNLAEFMEHDDKALPIDIRVLGREAGRCHAWAKALHYKELEFLQDQSGIAVEALIQINNQLQQYDAAIGILRRAQLYKDGITLRETWFEKLERWEEALEFYHKREEKFPDQAQTFDVIMGKMRCLHALGEWETLSALAQDKWHTSSLDIKRAVAPLATAAAWGLGQWDLMDDYLSVMKANTPDRSFFGAILALHRNQYREAAMFVQKAREGLDTELSALVSESYNRAYTVVVRVQMLAELEEIIVYKQSNNNPAKQEAMRQTWEKRLLGCQRNVEVWQRMLKVRALVISPKENMQMMIKFANLCRKSGRIGLAEKHLKMLIGTDISLDYVLPFQDANSTQAINPGPRVDRQKLLIEMGIPPPVQYAVLKFHWANGKHEAALAALQDFTKDLADHIRTLQLQVHNMNSVDGHNTLNINSNGFALDSNSSTGMAHNVSIKQFSEHYVLLARCYLKQGEWQVSRRKGDWNHEVVSEILDSYRAAANFNPNWYKAWHSWALANFEIVQALGEKSERDRDFALPQSIIIDYVVPAIHGFFRSIALSQGSSLQDTLRLLTLWFAHGGSSEVNLAVTEGFGSVSVDTWLEVIPQLIARINQPNARVRQSIHNLLADVGRAHPQALVYPLTVAMKSAPNTRRSRSAMQIMESMRQHSSRLVEQADIVSHELIRVAVLWHELWHEGLEEASRLYFGDRNIEGMFATLAPLHDMLDKGPETLREISFAQTFGRDLQEAREWCNTYRTTGDVSDINQAWDLYYQVFRRIARQLPQLNNLELAYVSPKLLHARNLDLAVPGTYVSGKPIIRIVNFDTTFIVISSKQRPRKLSLQGSDGNTYTFVLKGHEDIRQDERVMQLFGLCNTLMINDSESYKRHLNIQRYPAIPLSQNSGLLGWVPNSDTLHVLIREYRESRKILLNIEHRIMLQMAPDYDNLTLMQKVEVFGYALDNTTGQDLYRVLWLKSKSSESWLERRTNYTRSLGVMSMVGYILGLGDRHPSNLMLDKVTGKIIHIDFGDCFEIAMHREKYPERVPFRLTRMLTYAMEVSNIEGSFRITCENVMRVLRDNKESLMAVLEAFIHDPLLNWRLTGGDVSPTGPNFRSDSRESLIVDQVRRASLLATELPPNIADHVTQPSGPPSSRVRARTNSSAQGNGLADTDVQETQNARAMQVLHRVKEKLSGTDFKAEEELNYINQVDKLLNEATKLENLCQHYIGWCSFW
ncbi:BgTH12-07303 [Blumeria graminis f. sp. triticale]|uniref:non-specific serine/threonine protein kinase n=3 Tax=Blumeria graminis TaxID=34373 RepID=A0A061HFB7_BLUGR|nr:PIK-related protein kinase [Blumeria graminis f. sp. tritici 96224]CAD6506377.1 BgTH12-07303 [Blumeria graminis f. sp. triticale]VDB95170.1 Bgt-213 [Blumeria graminis f. sp. tritici]